MPNWTKVLTLIIGLSGYSAAVIMSLFRGEIPSVGTLGVPAALILALAPSISIGRNRARTGAAARRRNNQTTDETAEDEGNEA